eukprot:52475-Eustigmatos_ZCMA.PRE.3
MILGKSAVRKRTFLTAWETSAWLAGVSDGPMSHSLLHLMPICMQEGTGVWVQHPARSPH